MDGMVYDLDSVFSDISKNRTCLWFDDKDDANEFLHQVARDPNFRKFFYYEDELKVSDSDIECRILDILGAFSEEENGMCIDICDFGHIDCSSYRFYRGSRYKIYDLDSYMTYEYELDDIHESESDIGCMFL